MNSDNLHIYMSFLAPALGLLCTTVVFLQKFVENKKLKKILEKTEQITKEIIPCILEAEKFPNFTGEEKKRLVMTKLNQYAIDNHLKFDQEKVSNQIEELIQMTKMVNFKSQENLQVIDRVIDEEITSEPISIEEQIKSILENIRG